MKYIAYILILFVNSSENRYDFTNKFISVSNGENGLWSTGMTIGDGIDSEITYWVYDGNIDLSSTRLQLNNADLLIRGTIVFNSEEATIEQMLENERIMMLHVNDTIHYD